MFTMKTTHQQQQNNYSKNTNMYYPWIISKSKVSQCTKYMEWKDVHPNMFATIVSLDWQWQQERRCQWLLQNMREKNFWFSFSICFVVVLLIFLHLHLILRLQHSSYKHKTKRWRHMAFTFFSTACFFFSQTPQKKK